MLNPNYALLAEQIMRDLEAYGSRGSASSRRVCVLRWCMYNLA